MKLMVINLKRITLLYKAFFRVNILNSLEYRIDYLVTFIATSTYTMGYLLFLDAILRQVPIVAGWKFEHLLVLFSVNQLVFYFSWGLFRDSLHQLPIDIKNGNVDKLLKLPIPMKLSTTIRGQSFDFIFPSILQISIFIYATRELAASIGQWTVFGVMFAIGLIIYYYLVHIVTVISFWVIESEDLTGILEEMTDYTRYPLSFFPKPVAAFFIFIVPLLLVVYVPATALLTNLFDWKLAGISILMCMILKSFSDFLWKKALQYYSGVSS